MDTTPELKADGLQWYQELIGTLRWACEIGRVDILLETTLMASYSAMPRLGHLENVLHIFGYLKSHKKFKLCFDCSCPQFPPNKFKEYEWEDFYKGVREDIPIDPPTPRGRFVSTTMFVDASHANDKKSRRSHTGILIFLNKAPIHWYSKKQPTVEVSTFGAEFVAMRIGVELVKALRYKLRMFGIPIEGSTNVFCNNESVTQNTIVPESTLKRKHHSIAYHLCREAVAAKIIRVAFEGTKTNLADLFKKLLAQPRREFLLERFSY